MRLKTTVNSKEKERKMFKQSVLDPKMAKAIFTFMKWTGHKVTCVSMALECFCACKARGPLGHSVSSQVISTLALRQKLSMELGAHQLGEADWSVSSRGLPISTSQCWGYRHTAAPALYRRS